MTTSAKVEQKVDASDNDKKERKPRKPTHAKLTLGSLITYCPRCSRKGKLRIMTRNDDMDYPLCGTCQWQWKQNKEKQDG